MDPLDPACYRPRDWSLQYIRHRHRFYPDGLNARAWQRRRLFLHFFPKSMLTSAGLFHHSYSTVGDCMKTIEAGGDTIFCKFSPDGQFLVGFSRDQRMMRIFRLVNSSHKSDHFGDFFKLVWERTLVVGAELIAKDICLFVQGSLVLVVTSAPASTVHPHPTSSNNINLQSLHPRTVSWTFSLTDDIRIKVLSLKDGSEVDEIVLKADLVVLSPLQAMGIGLCRDRLGILSLHHQTISIFRISKDGKLLAECQIGTRLYPDEELTVPECLADRLAHLRRLDGFHQKLAKFLFQEKSGLDMHRGSALLASLQFGRFQFIDHGRLLIRLVSEGPSSPTSLTLGAMHGNSIAKAHLQHPAMCQPQAIFYAVWRIDERCAEHFWRDSDPGLHEFLARNLDLLVASGCSDFGQSLPSWIGTPSSCPVEHTLHREEILTKQESCSNKKVGKEEYRSILLARLANQFPKAPQMHIASPFLDKSLFWWDERLLNDIDKPQLAPEDSANGHIAWYSRRERSRCIARQSPRSMLKDLIYFPDHSYPRYKRLNDFFAF